MSEGLQIEALGPGSVSARVTGEDFRYWASLARVGDRWMATYVSYRGLSSDAADMLTKIAMERADEIHP